MSDKDNARNIIEYIVAVVNEFATKYNLSEQQSFRYINFHGGISFIKDNYGIMHSLSFRDAVEGVALYCKNKGGRL